MYFAKARKQMEEQDMREVEEKLEKYQRSDTARVQLQQGKGARSSAAADDEEAEGSRRSSRGDFRPEELPDGAFVSPKHTPAPQASPAKTETTAVTVSRPAEYIGSFSVTGTDEDARARQVEMQLQSLQSVTKSKKVILTVSLDGIKVSSGDSRSLYMFHELKRISYATCDPEHCQFSFLAREKQMNVQYCHAFLTQAPQQAEELNLIIGNAFKMAYAQQRDKQPTFHELIEAQVAEQQAKFREIEKHAQVELQRKLAEIARPTPLNEQAIQRMGQRKMMTDDDLIVGSNKLWARHASEQVQHRVSLYETYFSDITSSPAAVRLSDPDWQGVVKHPEMLRQESTQSGSSVDFRKSSNKYHAHKNISKHNSAPLFPAQVSSPSDEPPAQGENVSCVIPHHPLSAQVLRVSLETKKDGKFKGSPVTALKEEIDRLVDRRFLASQLNGSESKPSESQSSGLGSSIASSSSGGVLQGLERETDQKSVRVLQGLERETDQKSVRQEMVRQQIHMATRPLPSVPQGSVPPPSPAATPATTATANSNGSSNPRGGGSPRQRPTSSYQCRSFDDQHFLPSSSSSPAPLSALRQPNGVHCRHSPRRKQPRPLSEIATGSGAVGVGGGKGYDNWHPAGLYEVSPLAAACTTAGATAAGVSGPSPRQSPRHQALSASSRTTATPPTCSPQHHGGEGGVYVYGPSPAGVEMRAGGKGPRFESSSSGQQVPGGGACPSGNTEPVLRYQNDSPFHLDDPEEASGKSRQGLESLMCLDRSHIEDPALRQASWYQAGIPREIALEILQQEEVGSFIIRDSTTHPGCFALSVRVPKFENSAGISHYLILKTQRGVKLKGLDKEWPTLTALVTHHTVMPEMLPCTLRLPRNAKNLTFRQADRDDQSYDETYQRLTDLTAMTGQLKL